MSKKQKLTPWFSGCVKPKRVGVYQTILHSAGGYSFGKKFSYWNGERWSDSATSVEEALIKRDQVGGQQKTWRGVAK